MSISFQENKLNTSTKRRYHTVMDTKTAPEFARNEQGLHATPGRPLIGFRFLRWICCETLTRDCRTSPRCTCQGTGSTLPASHSTQVRSAPPVSLVENSMESIQEAASHSLTTDEGVRPHHVCWIILHPLDQTHRAASCLRHLLKPNSDSQCS